jgi:hypothetical protein
MIERLALAVVVAWGAACREEPPPPPAPVEVQAGLDHAEWSRLLRTYVDERGRVDYTSWKASADDREALRDYLSRLAVPADPPANGDDRAATLINAYNALTICWILDHYPTRSIRSVPDSFTGQRHRLGGRAVSLDQIEHEALRPTVGYRVHAGLVCAARSCPPLAREAFAAATLGAQLDAAMARWLAREDLNRFDPASGRARVSAIFDWFAADFDRADGVPAVLKRHGPEAARVVAARPDLKVEYLDYDWSLNDQRPPPSYGRLRLFWDELRGVF